MPPLPARSLLGRPPRVSLEDILQAVRDLGLGDLTLKRVADHLGVTPPALYRYVRDLDDLIGLFADSTMSRFPLPEDSGQHWSAWAFEFAIALRDFYRAVPGLAQYSIGRTPAKASVVARYDRSIAIAIRSGFDAATALGATRAITEFVHSWVAREERRERETPAGRSFDEDLIDRLRAASLGESLFAKSLEADLGRGPEARFEFTIKALIAGLVRAGLSAQEEQR